MTDELEDSNEREPASRHGEDTAAAGAPGRGNARDPIDEAVTRARQTVSDMWDRLGRPGGAGLDGYMRLHTEVHEAVLKRFCVPEDHTDQIDQIVRACLNKCLPALYLRHLGVKSPSKEDLFRVIDNEALRWWVALRDQQPMPQSWTVEEWYQGIGVPPATVADDDALASTISPGANGEDLRRALSLLQGRQGPFPYRVAVEYVDRAANSGSIPGLDDVAQEFDEYRRGLVTLEDVAAALRLLYDAIREV